MDQIKFVTLCGKYICAYSFTVEHVKQHFHISVKIDSLTVLSCMEEHDRFLWLETVKVKAAVKLVSLKLHFCLFFPLKTLEAAVDMNLKFSPV